MSRQVVTPRVPATRRGRARLVAGIVMLSAGLLLLLSVGLYFGYRANSSSDLERLTVSAERPLPSAGLLPGGEPQPLLRTPREALWARYQSAYVGTAMNPKYWHQPLWAGTDARQDEGLPAGYRLISASDSAATLLPKRPALRLAISVIGVDSQVQELAVLDLGDSRQYETPKRTVGHIPGTANPGERGSGWYFGHLESLVRGEGSVFRRLPQIAGLLEQYLATGEGPVYVSVSSQDGVFLYQVVSTRVVHEKDLHLYDTDEATITLVTCYPRFVYDQRVVVTARLVGVKG